MKNLFYSFNKLPDFLIIGVQKGGTTSLFEYLSEHPRLNLPAKKEIHFFDKKYEKGVWWYKKHFPLNLFFNSPITGEATPDYIYNLTAPAKIAKIIPNVKLIVLLRNPIDRAYSNYQMECLRGKEPLKTFNEAILAECERCGSKFNFFRDNESRHAFNQQYFSYIQRGNYYEQLVNWFKYFPKEQFLFLKSEDFFSRPKEELKKVYEFLNIEEIYPSKLTVFNGGGNYPQLDQRTRDFILEYYKPSVAKLYALLGRDFNWFA